MYNDKKVSISVGGGLGDAIQIYLANPESHCSDGPNNYPTTNHRASIWFRRLRTFKERNPNTEITLFLTSHSSATKELFETNPYIDHIVEKGWSIPRPGHYRLWDVDYGEYDKVSMSAIKEEMEWNPIFWFYDYNEYEVDDPDLFLTDSDKEVLISEEYITSHPYAPEPRNVMPIYKYKELGDIIDYPIITLGSASEGCQYNVRQSLQLILNSKGFVGTHSSMWLPAVYAGWKYGIRTVCFIPQIEHFTRMRNSKSAVVWGFDQPFNKTYEFINQSEASELDMHEVADWILNDTRN